MPDNRFEFTRGTHPTRKGEAPLLAAKPESSAEEQLKRKL